MKLENKTVKLIEWLSPLSVILLICIVIILIFTSFSDKHKDFCKKSKIESYREGYIRAIKDMSMGLGDQEYKRVNALKEELNETD
jgi:hypothetical protein